MPGVDHDGLGGRFRTGLRARGRLRWLLTLRDDEAVSVRRPFVAGDLARHVRELTRFTAVSIQKPHLRR